jgi:hypothetical protein
VGGGKSGVDVVSEPGVGAVGESRTGVGGVGEPNTGVGGIEPGAGGVSEPGVEAVVEPMSVVAPPGAFELLSPVPLPPLPEPPLPPKAASEGPIKSAAPWASLNYRKQVRNEVHTNASTLQ